MSQQQMQPALISLEQEVDQPLLPQPRHLDALVTDTYSPIENAKLFSFVQNKVTPLRAYEAEALSENLVAGKNTYVYDAHTYHTKVPPQAIAKLIDHYTSPGDLVLDPFCGSGMTGVAALQEGRTPILIDLSPAATFIARNFLTPVDPKRYQRAVQRVLEITREEESELYGTSCRDSDTSVPMEYMVWSYGLVCDVCGKQFILWDVARDEKSNVRESKIKSEFDCPHCGAYLSKRSLKRTRLYPVQVGYRCRKSLQESKAEPDTHDIELIETINARGVPQELWFPSNMLPIGINTRQAIAHGLDTVDKLYTTRSLRAVARLWDIARRWPDTDMAVKLMFTVTSLYQRVTRLSEFRFWGGSGNIANYNVPMIFNEQNVFKVFRRKAKTIYDYLATCTFRPGAPFCISTQSATDLSVIPDNSIDYVFTDPPFGSNINYSEMNFLWESWLGAFTETQDEAIVSRAQGKTLDDYRTLMTQALREIYRVIKPRRWLTMEFHNSSAETWQALQNAVFDAGFVIERTQTLDKRHGTFKQFVSDNAVGYDLVLHCAKRDADTHKSQPLQYGTISDSDLKSFLSRVMRQFPDEFTVRYLHVNRDDEFDTRKLYSLWVKEKTEAQEVVGLDYEGFRKRISAIAAEEYFDQLPKQPRLVKESKSMKKPKTLPAFTTAQQSTAHLLLASQVATMMGRKLEEGDWARVYCTAKGLPLRGWSNLNIDVMHEGFGVEHKMLCVRSDRPIKEYCGTTLMHPAATRSIRIPKLNGDPTEVARDVLQQYSDLIRLRRKKVSEDASGARPDVRTGWLLWQESLQEFLYFEQEMLPPNPNAYYAEWRESGGGSRKASKNLWVYEADTGIKRYSITTSAGAKIQPYFDVPPPNSANLNYFRVQGEELSGDAVRIWVTSTTALLIKQFLGSLDGELISREIIESAVLLAETRSEPENETQPPFTEIGPAQSILITKSAYSSLVDAFTGVSDEHRMQLFVHYKARRTNAG